MQLSVKCCVMQMYTVRESDKDHDSLQVLFFICVISWLHKQIFWNTLSDKQQSFHIIQHYHYSQLVLTS